MPTARYTFAERHHCKQYVKRKSKKGRVGERVREDYGRYVNNNRRAKTNKRLSRRCGDSLLRVLFFECFSRQVSKPP